MGKKLLITGGGGFIGSSVIELLYASTDIELVGLELTALDITFSEELKEKYPKVTFVQKDITDFTAMSELFSTNNFDYVVHLSAILSKNSEMKDAKVIYDVNVNGTTNIALLSAHTKSKLIFLSTAMVYGDNEGPFTEEFPKSPQGYYAISKSIGEDIIIEESATHKLNYTIFRPSVIYGPTQKGSMFIPAVCQSAIDGKPFGMTEGKQKRDFVFIDDVTSAIKLAIIDEKVSGIFNLSSRETTLLRDVPTFVKDEVPTFEVEFGKVPYRDNEIWDYSLDNEKLKSFGWSAKTALRDGLKKVLVKKKGE